MGVLYLIIFVSIVFVLKEEYKNGSVSDGVLKISAIAFFFVAALYLLAFTNAHFLHIVDAQEKNYSKALSSDTVLGIIATVATFSSILVYIFKKIVRKDVLEEANRLSKKMIENVEEMARRNDHDERIASKIEGRIMTSFMLTKLFKLGVTIKINSTENATSVVNLGKADLNGIINAFESGDYLEKAIFVDESVVELSKKFYGDKHKDIVLKTKNNRGNNLALKHKCYSKKSDENYAIEFEKDKTISLEIREELLAFIKNDSRDHYHDITERHLNSFMDTCMEIEEVFLKQTKTQPE